jgi:hypothetical protein
MIDPTDEMTEAAIRAFWLALADGPNDVQTAMRAAIAAALDAMPSGPSA